MIGSHLILLMNYLALTKPRISLLFAITALSSLAMEKSIPLTSLRAWIIILATFLVGGGANALNQYFERDIDSKMARTAKKRPIPLGKVTPLQALIFAITISVTGLALLSYYGTALAVFWGVATIIYYSFFYTLYLKPRTPYNIVIGGAAGATGPLIGYAAATGSISWGAVIMFLIIFFWTPPHFWALALCCKEDYTNANYPMLPLVVGDEATRKQIFGYSLLLLPLSTTLYFFKESGIIYLIGSLVLGLPFLYLAWRVLKEKTIKSYWQLFGYSIAYLMFLFIVIIIDAFI